MWKHDKPAESCMMNTGTISIIQFWNSAQLGLLSAIILLQVFRFFEFSPCRHLLRDTDLHHCRTWCIISSMNAYHKGMTHQEPYLSSRNYHPKHIYCQIWMDELSRSLSCNTEIIRLQPLKLSMWEHECNTFDCQMPGSR